MFTWNVKFSTSVKFQTTSINQLELVDFCNTGRKRKRRKFSRRNKLRPYPRKKRTLYPCDKVHKSQYVYNSVGVRTGGRRGWEGVRARAYRRAWRFTHNTNHLLYDMFSLVTLIRDIRPSQYTCSKDYKNMHDKVLRYWQSYWYSIR